MRANTMIGLVLVTALIIGSVMMYASVDLISSTHPDPYYYDTTYSVTGDHMGEKVTGEAVCETVYENGSFHNYSMSVITTADGTVTFSDQFTVIFQDDMPRFFEPMGSSISGITDTTSYEQMADGRHITLDISDHCHIIGFTLSYEGWDLVATSS